MSESSVAEVHQRSVIEWLQLASRLRAGVTVKDRDYYLKTYKECFLGCAAVAWLLKNSEAKTLQQAIHLGNQMISQGFFHHVRAGRRF